MFLEAYQKRGTITSTAFTAQPLPHAVVKLQVELQD